MLKLIYHSGAFGPIDLEYDGPVVRVGSNDDNDLVLHHPSIAPHHCLLVFRGEKILCLPPSGDIPTVDEIRRLTGPEFAPGDQLQIGDLEFALDHSSKTVAFHQIQIPAGDDTPTDLASLHFYCPNCRTFVKDTDVRHVGIVGHTKHDLCPKCSRQLQTQDLSS